MRDLGNSEPLTANQGFAGARVLIVEDDPEHAEIVSTILEMSAIASTVATNGVEALEILASDEFGLVLLDVGLPGMGGLEVCRSIRRVSQIPVIIVTGEYLDSSTTVQALGIGADDYVRKPYEPMELVARVRAVLRRSASTQATQNQRPPYEHGNLRFDFELWLAAVAGEEIQLSPTETRLLAYLAANAGRVVPHRELLREVWGPEYEDDKVILKVAISRLRSKISDNRGSSDHIITRTGVGYMAARPDAR